MFCEPNKDVAFPDSIGLSVTKDELELILGSLELCQDVNEGGDGPEQAAEAKALEKLRAKISSQTAEA